MAGGSPALGGCLVSHSGHNGMASFLPCEACPALMATWETVPLEGNAVWAQPQPHKPHDLEALTSMTWKHSLPWPGSTCLGSRKGWRLRGHWGRQGEVGVALSLKGSFPETTTLGMATGAVSNQRCPSASEDATVPSIGGEGNCTGMPTSSLLEPRAERPLTPVLPAMGRPPEGHMGFTSTMSHDVVTGQKHLQQ